jgi:N-acetylglucosamine-6-phosphate deacetylase
VLDAAGRWLAPGFIDIHIQGAGGEDVLNATNQALETISRSCARFGVTSLLATTLFQPAANNPHLPVAADAASRKLPGAAILGIHLEGPFICPDRRAGIEPQFICPPAATVLETILDNTRGRLRMMTIAPELPGAMQLVGRLRQANVVAALGHSDASFDDAAHAFAAGVSHVTHLFNAMAGFHHRSPGPLAALVDSPEVTAQLIPDGTHIHPAAVRLAWRLLGPQRIITITDGCSALGLPDGRYNSPTGGTYETKAGVARRPDGRLIGTAVGLNELLRRLITFTGCSPAEAVGTVTANPARLLGIHDRKGSIQPAKDADLVILDDDFSIWATIVAGRIVYRQSS